MQNAQKYWEYVHAKAPSKHNAPGNSRLGVFFRKHARTVVGLTITAATLLSSNCSKEEMPRSQNVQKNIIAVQDSREDKSIVSKLTDATLTETIASNSAAGEYETLFQSRKRH